MTVVDLRSDTVSRPTAAMRRAMADAPVGDDVYGEDPTIRELEQEVASLLGKEAALYVPSGTMANQIAMGLLAGPGTQVLIEERAHILNYEAGAASALWGITLRPVLGERGQITSDQVLAKLSPEDEHVAPVRVVALENTHNRAGGAVWPLERMREVQRTAAEQGLGVHLDGARLWNASAATGVPLADYARDADTVSVCFSKGLGAPVGSAIASTADRIRRGRYHRKRLGGGMRQAGIIAAGALHAVRHHRERLVDDHRRAARIGARLEEAGLAVMPVETNMVIAHLGDRDPVRVERALAERGVLAHDTGGGQMRFVTHLDVDDGMIDHALTVLGEVLKDAPRSPENRA